jgi:hypothetical protein
LLIFKFVVFFIVGVMSSDFTNSINVDVDVDVQGSYSSNISLDYAVILQEIKLFKFQAFTSVDVFVRICIANRAFSLIPKGIK